MKIDVKYIILALVIGLTIAGVSANPQILTYYGGYWFNDHMEEVNPNIIVDYVEISQDPWIIEVIDPILYYHTDWTFSDNETIIIKKGNDTIEVTADVTTTLTITP